MSGSRFTGKTPGPPVRLRGIGRVLDAIGALGRTIRRRLGRPPAGMPGVAPLGPEGLDAVLRRLEGRAEPGDRVALIQEALELLDPADAALVRDRVAGAGRGLPRDGRPAADFASAADRFARRLAWVAALDEQGVPPIRRRALGQIQFFGKSAQEVAEALRLPIEVVALWVREGDVSTVSQ